MTALPLPAQDDAVAPAARAQHVAQPTSGVVRPTLRAAVVFTACLALAVLPALHAGLWGAWVVGLAGFVGLLGADLLALPRRRDIRIHVDTATAVGVGDTLAVALAPSALGPAERQTLLLDVSGPLVTHPTTGEVRAGRRGVGRLDAVWARAVGPWGLLAREVRCPLAIEVTVTPNLRRMRAEALRFFSQQSRQVGVKVEKHRGDGSEFDSLMEFQPGLDHRHIDWKSSGRHGKLLVRLNRVERNHHVVLAIDTGRLMAEPVAGMPRLDHAIDAALLLGWVSSRAGDRVSLLAYDAEPRLALEPRPGAAGFAQLQAAVARLDYSSAETNHTVGLTWALERLTRRALVVVLTDFADSVAAELMIENLGRLARRHLVLFAALQDPALRALTEAPPTDRVTVASAVVAHAHLTDRQHVLRRLAQHGITTVDLPAGAVAPAVVNRYLDLKRRERVG